jgi:hypothetical protein
MIPKVEEAAAGLRAGIQRVAIVGADIPGAFRSVTAGDLRFGTGIYR